MVILDSVISIGKGAFAENEFTSVVIPSSVTSIGEDAFKYNKTLIVIPDSVTNRPRSKLGG